LVRPRRRGDTADAQTTFAAGLALPGYRAVRCGLPAVGALLATWRQRLPYLIDVATEGPLGLSAVRTANVLGLPVVSGFHTNFHRYVEHYGARWLRRPVMACLRRSGRGSQIRLDDILHRRVDAVANRAFHRSLRPPPEAEGQRHGGDVGGEADAGSHRAAVDGGRVEDPAG